MTQNIKIILLKMRLSYKKEKSRLANFNLLYMNNDDNNDNDNNEAHVNCISFFFFFFIV